MSKSLPAYVALLLFAIGCTKRPSESTEPSKASASTNAVAVAAAPDPVAEMKECVRHISTPGATDITATDVSYDVQKTDSMISPFTGYVIYTPNASRGGMVLENKIALAYQENNWVVKGFSFHAKSGGADDQWLDYPVGAQTYAKKLLGLK